MRNAEGHGFHATEHEEKGRKMTTILGELNRTKVTALVVAAIAAAAGLLVVLAFTNGAAAQEGGDAPPTPPPGPIGDALAALDAKLDVLEAQVDSQGDGLSDLQASVDDLAEGQASLATALDSLLGAAATVEPFQATADCTIGFDDEDFRDDTCEGAIRVPSDKLLIIEHVSARGSTSVEAGETISVRLQTRAGGVGRFGAHPLGSFTLEDREDLVQRDALSVSLRLYADPGSGVQLFAASDQEASSTQLFFTVTGRLVDAPGEDA